jgi:hypothetical protein
MTTNGRTKDGNNPRSVQRFQRAILIGIPSADFIKASGHSTARQAGHMEATDQVISTSKNPCLRGPSTYGHYPTGGGRATQKTVPQLP